MATKLCHVHLVLFPAVKFETSFKNPNLVRFLFYLFQKLAVTHATVVCEFQSHRAAGDERMVITV